MPRASSPSGSELPWAPSRHAYTAPGIGSVRSWPDWPPILRQPTMIDLDAITPLDDDLIDRIVDGTLSPAERRAAIDRLDRLPAGWKRCAAAFLEAQFWREAFRAVGDSEKNKPERRLTSISRVPNRVSRSNPRWLRGALA